jgi:hypothetical protein
MESLFDESTAADLAARLDDPGRQFPAISQCPSPSPARDRGGPSGEDLGSDYAVTWSSPVFAEAILDRPEFEDLRLVSIDLGDDGRDVRPSDFDPGSPPALAHNDEYRQG